MFCPKCGTQLPDGTGFCSNCGTKIEPESKVEQQPQQFQQQQQSQSQQDGAQGKFPQDKLKGIAGIAIAIVAVILIVKLLGGLFGGHEDTVVKVYDSDKEKSTIYVNNKLIDTVDGDASIRTNADKSAIYVVSDGDAYLVKGSKLKKIMDDCTYLQVAAYGKAALLKNEDGELSRYNGSKLEEICDDEVEDFVISGNGKAYAYISDGKAYVGKKAGKEEKVKDIQDLIAMSEDGGITYAYKGNEDSDNDDDDYYSYDYSESNDLVMINLKGETEKIEKEVSSIVALNKTGTEIMFIHSGKTYVSVKGKEPEKVSGDAVYGILLKESERNGSGYVYPVSTFKNRLVYLMDDDYKATISKLNGKYEAEELIDDIGNPVSLDKNLSGIYYTDGDELCYCKLSKNAKEKEIAGDVKDASASTYGNIIYYVDDDDTMFYVKGTGKPKEVGDVDSEDITFTAVVDGVFYYAEGDDYYCVKGKKKEKLKVDGMDYDSTADVIYAYKDDEAYIVKGTKLKKLKGDYKEISDITVY